MEDISNYIINKIIKERNKSAKKIQNFWISMINYLFNFIEYNRKKLIKKVNIIKQILTSRNKASNTIITVFKNLIFQIKVHELINKLKGFYTIIPNFENSEDIKICIIYGNNHEKTLKLKYCPIRKEYLIDVQRSYIKQLRYKFYFIVNGIRKVSNNFQIIKVKNFKYNIINFKEIQDKEFLLEDQYDQEIKYYYFSHNSSETTSKSSKGSIDDLKLKLNKDKLLGSALNLGIKSYKSQIEINCVNNTNIKKVKSILRKRKFNREKSSKKVSFGNIEIES